MTCRAYNRAGDPIEHDVPAGQGLDTAQLSPPQWS
jgi:hypothetical protein